VCVSVCVCDVKPCMYKYTRIEIKSGERRERSREDDILKKNACAYVCVQYYTI
jgi:hypothetical protein